MLVYDEYYTDEYLKSNILTSQESKALEWAGSLGLTDSFYLKRAVVLKTYIIVCLDNQTAKDDLYEIKLRVYKDELDEVLKGALNAGLISGELFNQTNALKNHTIKIKRS